jgi:hypothetical protein
MSAAVSPVVSERATSPRLSRPSYRNFFDRNDVIAGFRTCAL